METPSNAPSVWFESEASYMSKQREIQIETPSNNARPNKLPGVSLKKIPGVQLDE